ncbi:MAG: hypothetical protein Q9196_004475 [Gyalolechia fulgens]
MAQVVEDAQDLMATSNMPDTGHHFELAFNAPMNRKTYKVDPLTDHSIAATDLSGTLRPINPGNVDSLPEDTIAYISCDDGAYPRNLDAKETLNRAIHHSPPPVSVILYSLTNTSCSLRPHDLPTPSIYTMQDVALSQEVFSSLQVNTTMVQNTTISPNGSDEDDGGGILGKSPTTAVAMIILYSITGLITALFLIIIVVGAVRAHRHPERYGPRNVIGRPRQSRAKGIARAMLETIPIVKFGDQDNGKRGDQPRDIEMVPPQTRPEASTQGQVQHEAAPPAVERRTTQASTPGAVTEQAVGQDTLPQSTNDPTANADNGLACSVCTDDFAKGQDVRVLPCNHKFHPDCIDPWLLNVSGTCPLCRVDLRPTTTNEDGSPNHNGDHSEALTSFAAHPQANLSRRSSRARPLHYLHHYLNRGRMEEATPQERLEALRNLRLVNRSHVHHATQQDSGDASATGDRGTRNRLSARFSRVFGGDRSRPVSRTPQGTSTPVVQESRDEDTRDDESGPGAGTGAGATTT